MFHPCGHRVIVRRDHVKETYGDSGIIIAVDESAKKMEKANVQTGVVVAVGPDAWKAFRMLDENGKEVNGKSWAKPGDYVLYAKYAGRNVDDPFTPDEGDLIILNDEDILTIITEEPTVIPECKTKEKAEK